MTMRPLKTQSAVSETTLRCSWRHVVPSALWRMVECTSCRWLFVVRAAVKTLQCDPVSKRSICKQRQGRQVGEEGNQITPGKERSRRRQKIIKISGEKKEKEDMHRKNTCSVWLSLPVYGGKAIQQATYKSTKDTG